MALLAVSAQADPVVFILDPNESRITLSGDVVGVSVQEQGPGSLTTQFEGSIRASLTSSNLQFTGGSVIDAVTNGVWKPLPEGKTGQAPADFGGKASTFLANFEGAFREVVLDLTSDVLAFAEGKFDSTKLVFGFPAQGGASFDYRAGSLVSGSQTLTGLTTNQVAATASLTLAGDVQTLSIGVQTELKFAALSPGDSTLRFRGQLVARRTVLPVIRTISVRADSVMLEVTGVAGQPYYVEGSTDLAAWQRREATVESQSESYTFDLQPRGGIEFFRVGR
jgi:hypothetical protein